jgi:hypothetical protein
MNTVEPTLLAVEIELGKFLVPGLALAAALLVAALVVGVANRWRQLTRVREKMSASDQLAQFRSLYEEGALSEEEFKRLRAILGGEMRQDLQVPAHRPEEPPGPEQTGITTPNPEPDRPQ